MLHYAIAEGMSHNYKTYGDGATIKNKLTYVQKKGYRPQIERWPSPPTFGVESTSAFMTLPLKLTS